MEIRTLNLRRGEVKRKVGRAERARKAPSYIRASRDPFLSGIAIFPLLAAYEFAAVKMNGPEMAGVRNGADVLLKQFLFLIGIKGIYSFGLVVAATFFIVMWVGKRRSGDRIRWGYFPLMLLESLLYSLLFGRVVGALTGLVLKPFLSLSRSQLLVTSLGAGIYEELVFRMLAISIFCFMLGRILGVKKVPSYIISVIFSSILFAGFHYVGSLGEALEVRSFTFRFISGLVLSTVYVCRGLGIATYTHSLYDLLVTANVI